MLAVKLRNTCAKLKEEMLPETIKFVNGTNGQSPNFRLLAIFHWAFWNWRQPRSFFLFIFGSHDEIDHRFTQHASPSDVAILTAGPVIKIPHWFVLNAPSLWLGT